MTATEDFCNIGTLLKNKKIPEIHCSNKFPYQLNLVFFNVSIHAGKCLFIEILRGGLFGDF